MRPVAAELCVAASLAFASSALCQASVANLTVNVAIAAAPQRSQLPALSWLCADYLPQLAEWPTGLDPTGAFRLTITADAITVNGLTMPLAAEVAVTGSCTIGDGQPMLFECTHDGVEDWFVPHAFVTPAPWLQLAQTLDALGLDCPRTLSAAVLTGHLAGGFADGDPRGELLRHGASLCGDVTWTAWSTPTHLRVRGRSSGGLAMPTALLCLAAASGLPMRGLSLRAFSACDADRAEAARQLLRHAGDDAVPTLRAMLHADDTTRLAAIDTLVRRDRCEDMPAIVAAANPDNPWATVAAADAIRRLWPHASPEVRQRTRTALARSQSLTLRALDVEQLTVGAVPSPLSAPTAPQPVRALVWLAIMALGLTGLWARERARLANATS